MTSLGLSTTPQPAINAGIVSTIDSTTGKFHGAITPTTGYGTSWRRPTMPGIEAGVSVASPAPNTCAALAIASAMKPCTAATSTRAMRCRPVSADSAATSSAACASNAAPSARSAAARPSTPSACHAGCAARTASQAAATAARESTGNV